MLSFDVLIVGSGHGGASAAIALRQKGFEGSLAIVSADPDPPYERPPLSKDYLGGIKPFERILIRPPEFWAEREVSLLPKKKVVAVDPAAHLVTTENDGAIGYGALIWAAGGVPRRLGCAGEELAGVHRIRSRADVDAVLSELPGAATIAVIGGGYIGLEAAAVLIGLGKQVCVIEALDRVLARVAGEPLSRFYEREHCARGVDLRLDATVVEIEGRAGRVRGVRLESGETIGADLVLVGIGIEAAVLPLLGAGAEGGNGVRVDEACRTSLPDIYAVGDCALHANRFAGGAEVRLESVQNAHDQAGVAVRAILGEEVRYEAVPWFWSNQYDLRLQTVGLSIGHDQIVLRGDPVSRSFSLVYLKAGQVIALECVNATKDYVQGRKLVTERARPDPSRLANASTPLKELAAGT